ncbi:MAG: hypothetical protein HXX11_08460 [Desulfuromonadales bacterium]|nr:hypothetical protein [Desulfuromonadales bacterium]
MFFLPKGTPLFENIDVSKRRLPDILDKLGSTDFTGYAIFVFTSFTTLMVFETGQLLLVRLEEQSGVCLASLDALITLAGRMQSSDNNTMSAYKLSKELCARVRALLRGEALYRGEELKALNMRSLLEKIKEDRISGCLRAYTDDRSSLIFYNDGNPLGFFHDGSFDMETSASESQRIASLPGARVDLFANQGEEAVMEIDLLEIIDTQKIWELVRARNQVETAFEHPGEFGGGQGDR